MTDDMADSGTMLVLGEWRLTPERVALHEPSGAGVVADLHLGYDQARAAAGDAVPIRRLEDALAPLGKLASRGMRRLIVAGDLFERGVDAELLRRFHDYLKGCGIEWTGWTPGNHDRGWEAYRDSAPLAPEGVRLGRWLVTHGDGEESVGPVVMGHWHPRVRHKGRVWPGYLVGIERLMLPAFSTDAAGTARRGTFADGLRGFAIAHGRVVAAS
jgi:metallophosphoesterase superfamily enzyme